MRQHRRGPHAVARADGRRPAGRRRAAAVLDRRGVRPAARPAGSIRRWPRACRSRCCWRSALVLTWYATYHLARTRVGAAAAVRLRRRGGAGRLRARDRRRRPARADRLARPAAARPRDDARAGAAGRRRPLPLRAGGRAARPSQARAVAALAARALAASGAPSIAMLLGVGRRAGGLRSRDAGVRASRPGSPPARRSARPRRPRSAPGPGGSATLASPARRVGLVRAARLVHLAGLAARAVDAVALAPPPAPAATSRCRWAARGLARGLPGDGRLGPGADARPAGARGARGVRVADPAAQRRGGDRLVLGVLLHHRGGDGLGRLRRRCRPASRPSRPPTSPGCRRAIATAFSALALAFALAGTLAWLWLVRWRTGRNRHPLWKSLVLPAGGVSAVLAAGHDAAAAAARQRAQLSVAGRSASRAHVPRDARASPRRACRARRSSRSSTSAAIASMRRRRPPRRAATILLLMRPARSCRRGRAGSSSRASGATRNDDEVTAIYRRAGAAPAPGLGVRLQPVTGLSPPMHF